MKKISLILAVVLGFAITFTSCKKDEELTKADIIPQNFKVDIPNSISQQVVKASKADVLTGDDIYQHLGTFIRIGENAADIVQEIMRAIRQYDLDQAMTFSYQSDDDGRIKNVVIIENSDFEGTAWEYQLTMTDADSETNTDGGKAMQIFWNNDSVKGIAILKPYNINRASNDEWSGENTMFRIDYSEAGTDYEAEMTVYISGLVLPDPTVGDNKFAMETLKMFAGRKGNIIDVYGNSNHPNANFFDDNTGFNWAFIASGDENSDIGVAEVGLPPSTLNETDRNVILKDYSVYNVFYNQLTALGYNDTDIQIYLVNTQAPGYFTANGFLSAGTSPGTSYDEIETSMNTLSPYNPVQISNLVIEFKNDAS